MRPLVRQKIFVAGACIRLGDVVNYNTREAAQHTTRAGGTLSKDRKPGGPVEQAGKEKVMYTRMVRKMVVGFGLATVASVAAAGALGYADGRTAHGEIEYLETMPVMHGDLGEVTVLASRTDFPEVVVAARRVPVADGLMADVTVTAKRASPVLAEYALVAGLPAGALVQ
jgi:hypothetical protein